MSPVPNVYLGLRLVLCGAGRLPAAVRAALLQTAPEKTGDVVALLEPQLAAGSKIELVERQQIDKLVREQELSAAFGADAVGARVALGKLLQADLLVFVRAEPGSPPQASVAIAESHQGLRLVRGLVSLADAQAAANEVEKLAEAALEKLSAKKRELFAVPPFACNDLGFSYGYLKTAYPKLIEGWLIRQPGVVVVEFAEAKAIAKEIALTGGSDISRPLPLYVLGEEPRSMRPSLCIICPQTPQTKRPDMQVPGQVKPLHQTLQVKQ